MRHPYCILKRAKLNYLFNRLQHLKVGIIKSPPCHTIRLFSSNARSSSRSFSTAFFFFAYGSIRQFVNPVVEPVHVIPEVLRNESFEPDVRTLIYHCELPPDKAIS